MKIINGGVCAPLGFKANGIHCGIRKNKNKKDLALIYSEVTANTAAVYTLNLVKGAPLEVSKAHLHNGIAQAIICNSGNANTCNTNGIEVATQMCEYTAEALGIPVDNVIVASTGVIGQVLDINPIKAGIPSLVNGLGNKSDASAQAIMTTDTVKKELALQFDINGKTCHIGAIAKGSGMIHPNMATMLVFITTDVAISSEMLNIALKHDIQSTFNMLSVDGDTSTNDFVCLMANGMAGNSLISTDDANFAQFMKALNTITMELCKEIAADGEGATKRLECIVNGAKTLDDAKKSAKSVICSSLFKAAMFGADANWGRVLCAIGYSGANVDVSQIDVTFKSKSGAILVCKNGGSIAFSEDEAKKILLEKEIEIIVDLKEGEFSAKAWGCDLSYDYVKINGDYRS